MSRQLLARAVAASIETNTVTTDSYHDGPPC